MSENCKFNPLELVLATSDKDLYDTKTKKWRWDGNLYWAVECLDNRQSVISHNLVPNIAQNGWAVIDNNLPTTWNFCMSQGCVKNSDSLHIIFSFKPTSTDPKDFLQFVTDVYCHVTDFPKNYIKDKTGKEWFINIEEVSKSTVYPYAELWIADANPSKTTTSLSSTLESIPLVKPIVDNMSGKNLWIVLLVIILLIIIVGIVLYFIYVDKRRVKQATNNALLNIG